MLQSNPGLTSIAVAVASASLVGGYIYWALQNPSPGQLSAVHAQVRALSGSNHCVACHGEAGAEMKDACATCHEEIATQIAAGRGLHGGLPESTRDQCSLCHKEHHGNDFSITHAQSFALAGIDHPGQFGHANLDFHLAGAHEPLACVQCHPQAETAVLPIGKPRFLGLQQDCQACHEDVHHGSWGIQCETCHSQTQPFDRAANFRHADTFPLIGSHENLRCQSCHALQTEHSVEALLQKRVQLSSSAPRTCGQCHTSPHSPQMIALVASTTREAPEAACQLCHTTRHRSFKGPEARIDSALHARLGFSLDPPHRDVECQQCHSGYGKEQAHPMAVQVPPRSADDCRACHIDPHRGQFDDSAQSAKTQCLACHARQHFRPSQFDLQHHAETQFPLKGMHAQLDCAACHQPHAVPGSTEDVTVYRGVATQCRDCHADPHREQFDPTTVGAAQCSACHNDQSFARSTFTVQTHARTRFPLQGAHVAVGCNECHREVSIPDDSQGKAIEIPHGSARRFRGTPTRCDGCHADAHAGIFARVGDSGDQRDLDCNQCHSTGDFREVNELDFNHAQWTGFELEGVHGKIDCTRCHVRAERADALGRTFGKAAGRNCQDCHLDPHAGQFGTAEVVRCATCHRDPDSFRTINFDHQRDSRFALDDVHQRLQCTACHRPARLPNGQIVTRYKPLGTECADCHLPKSTNGQGRRSP